MPSERRGRARPHLDIEVTYDVFVQYLEDNGPVRLCRWQHVPPKRERADALYWHACLMFANGTSMNNQSLRERFGLSNEHKNMLQRPASSANAAISA